MAIKIIEYTIDKAGIMPCIEQFAGTQGDHRVTEIKFSLTDELYADVSAASGNGKLMYRFDVYDGEGAVWSSEPAEITNNSMSLELEERHTRYGGRVTVYLVITALSQDNETEIELYSFPAILKLKNRPEGEYQDGENYESISSLAEVVKQNANEASLSAQAAENSKQELQQIAGAVEEKLKNGEFDGLGVKNAQIINDELIITYTDGTSQNLGNVKGNTGAQGIQGEKGDKGDPGQDGKNAEIDQTYNSSSENAQSGKAVAEALGGYVQKRKTNGFTYQVYAIGDYDTYGSEYKDTTLDVEDHTQFEYFNNYGQIPLRQSNGNLLTNTPIGDLDCTNKKYVDETLDGRVPKLESSCPSAPFDNVLMMANSGSSYTSNALYFMVGSDCESVVPQPNFIARRNANGNIKNNAPIDDLDCTNKKYVDDLVGDIEAALDELHNYAQAIIGGAE